MGLKFVLPFQRLGASPTRPPLWYRNKRRLYHPLYFDKSLLEIGMCLKENFSDSPSNEYSRRQDMNSKSGEEQKKDHVRGSSNFDSNSNTEQKKVKMIMLYRAVERRVQGVPLVPGPEFLGSPEF